MRRLLMYRAVDEYKVSYIVLRKPTVLMTASIGSHTQAHSLAARRVTDHTHAHLFAVRLTTQPSQASEQDDDEFVDDDVLNVSRKSMMPVPG